MSQELEESGQSKSKIEKFKLIRSASHGTEDGYGIRDVPENNDEFENKGSNICMDTTVLSHPHKELDKQV